MKKNQELSQASVAAIEQQPSTEDHDDNVDAFIEPAERQAMLDVVENMNEDDILQQPATFDQDDKDHSDAESSQSSVDEPLCSNTDLKIDKTLLGQIYVDPMIAKLKITDVISSMPINTTQYRFMISFLLFRMSKTCTH